MAAKPPKNYFLDLEITIIFKTKNFFCKNIFFPTTDRDRPLIETSGSGYVPTMSLSGRVGHGKLSCTNINAIWPLRAEGSFRGGID